MLRFRFKYVIFWLLGRIPQICKICCHWFNPGLTAYNTTEQVCEYCFYTEMDK